ncbi:hypothetical protein QUF63_16855 [Anaerolineales bacterium HSG25]|nr:hypothetical protein [Anaerolineales bacterium HSG25]
MPKINEELAELHRLAWNMGRAPILFATLPDGQVRICNLYTVPARTKRDLVKTIHAFTFDEQLEQYEEEQQMTYMLRAERRGIEKGIQQGIQQSEQKVEEITKESKQKILQVVREDVIEVLMIRFGELPKLLVKTIKRLDKLPLLKTLHKKAVTIESIDLFEQFVADQLPDDDTPPMIQQGKHVE